MSRGILFDFDGTLAPNLDLADLRRQVIELTQRYEVPAPVYADRYIVEIVDAAEAWLTAPNEYRQDAEQLIEDFEVSAALSTDPYPSIRPMLQALRQDGARLAIVTRNCRRAVLQVFPDLLDFVEAIFARDDVTYLKPDPRHLSAALNAIDCHPDNSFMVGDGALDMHAGGELGLVCVGVGTGSNSAEQLYAEGADVVLEHCRDLPQWLAER